MGGPSPVRECIQDSEVDGLSRGAGYTGGDAAARRLHLQVTWAFGQTLGVCGDQHASRIAGVPAPPSDHPPGVTRIRERRSLGYERRLSCLVPCGLSRFRTS